MKLYVYSSIFLTFFVPRLCFTQTAEEYVTKGLEKIRQHEIKEAIEEFNRAIEIDPLYIPAYIQRGYCRRVQHDFYSALEDLNKVISLDSLYSEAYLRRGDIRVNLNEKKLAFADLVEQLELIQRIVKHIY